MHPQIKIVAATLLLAALSIGTGTVLLLGYLLAAFSIGVIIVIMARKMIKRIADSRPALRFLELADLDVRNRAFVRCSFCGRGLTGSWSKGRHDRYAYYHCRPKCRAVNISKARLEGLFGAELERLQPTPDGSTHRSISASDCSSCFSLRVCLPSAT